MSDALPRLKSGSAQLDEILGGGFPSNSLNILMGEPGSGKTILAERLMFANATTAERPVLYLTTLSEPVEKVVRYLQQFSFFDEAKLASGAIIYESFGAELQAGGIEALVPRLKEAIKALSPQLIVIDSFKAIHDLSSSVPGMRRMLFEISGLLTAYETTAFLIGEYDQTQISSFPEFAVADSVVELARQKQGTRDERYLRVLKLRGSGYTEGLHGFRITADGLEVFPRLTSPSAPPAYVANERRLPTGVPGLDKQLQGGVWAGSSTLVTGPTGSGKTTLALQFILEGLRHGEPGLYVNFQENPTQLARQIRAMGWDLEEARARGLHLLYASPVELQIDSIIVGLFQALGKSGIKRVAIDAIGDLMTAASDLQRLHSYLYALIQHFAVLRVASVMTLESAKFAQVSAESPIAAQISALSDAILTLSIEREGREMRRALQITKARGVLHDLNIHDVRINPKGLEVL